MSDIKILKKNELLFEEGDYPEAMYIVRSGQFKIFVKDGDIEKEISMAGIGSLIGEMGLFDKKLRSASARAISDSSVALLPYAQLESQLAELPEWVKITMKTLSEKLRTTNKKFF
jgi:CRP/FNR family cyclic AMP-dependent transcriptional regulator